MLVICEYWSCWYPRKETRRRTPSLNRLAVFLTSPVTRHQFMTSSKSVFSKLYIYFVLFVPWRTKHGFLPYYRWFKLLAVCFCQKTFIGNLLLLLLLLFSLTSFAGPELRLHIAIYAARCRQTAGKQKLDWLWIIDSVIHLLAGAG